MEYTEPAVDEVDIRPQHYQKLAAKIAGTPEERILSYLMLRSLKQARYTVDVLGHFALATKEYTHFTSPIRRYPDLIVHRALKWALAHSTPQPPCARWDRSRGGPRMSSHADDRRTAATARIQTGCSITISFR